MTGFNRISIRLRLILSTTSVSIIVLIILGCLSHLWNAQAEAEKIDAFLIADSGSSANALTVALSESAQGIRRKENVLKSQDYQEFLAAFFSYRMNHPAIYKTTLAIFNLKGELVGSSNDALLISENDIANPSVSIIDRQSLGGEASIFTVINGDLQYRLVTTPLRLEDKIFGQIRVACLLNASQDSINVFDRSLLMLLGMIGIFVLMGSIILTTQTLRPVNHMRMTAEQMNAQNLTQRLPVPPGHDELSSLAATFNTFLDRLEEAQKFQIQIVDDLSHQLRTPLTLIRGAVELALDKQLSPEDKQAALENCISDIDRMSQFLSTMLGLARLESRTIQLKCIPTDVVRLIHEQLMDLEPFWKERRQSVRFDLTNDDKVLSIPLIDSEQLPEDLPEVMVPVDPIMFVQVVTNLLSNAFKYCGEEGTIRIHLQKGKAPSPLHISFFNNGPSIPLDDIDRIFERFYRGRDKRNSPVHGAGDSVEQGFGLGLNIAKSIIELHGGTIVAANSPAGGCAFEITLP